MSSIIYCAKYLCEKSNWTLTNLKLQKILYIAHMAHFGKTNKKLVSEHFEAWDYGPVSPDLYHKVKAFGAKPIPNVFKYLPYPDDSEKSILDEAYQSLFNRPPGELVAITHIDGGAWAKNYVGGIHGIPISDQDIKDEYEFRLKQQKAARQQ